MMMMMMKTRQLFLLLGLLSAFTKAVETDEEYRETLESHLDLFHAADGALARGPSVFPPPTTEHIYLRPVSGTHRPDQDAVVAFAAEYPLANYVAFVESLRATGFAGDVILSVSPLDLKKADVWEYLSAPDNHIVIYAPPLVCFNAEHEQVESAKGGMRTCTCDGLYGTLDENGELQPLKDPRTPRTVQTLRYEIYWLMVQALHPNAWVLLVDARDTFFQANPFANLPRSPVTATSGTLYMFGENVEATRLGLSKSNRKWLAAAYGNHVTDLLADKPTICSGASLGEQVALDAYIKSMIAESDATGVVLAGADQGFHNRLYYSDKLSNAVAIDKIVVFDQGTGLVNNMGALRTKPLDEWGNGKIVSSVTDEHEANPRKRTKYTVHNWDGSVSAVVHQFDRHKYLSEYFFKNKGGQFMEQWRQRRKRLR